MPVIENLPDGHRLWSHVGAELPSQFFVIDDSGDRPEDTDDGPLCLDFGRSLYMCAVAGEQPFIAIPLLTAAGEQTRTPSNAATILQLAVRFGWTITDGAHTYAVARVGI